MGGTAAGNAQHSPNGPASTRKAIGLWDQTVTYDEEELPLPGNLRERLRQWADEYTATVGGENADWTMDDLVEHDRRGYALSRELQRALGPEYRIEYVFETRRLRQEMNPRAGYDEP